MAELRNPFNPMRFTGRGGMLTVEEASRLQDLIKGAGDTYTRTLNQILQQFSIDVTNVTTTPGPQGAAGVPGLDGADGEEGRPGRDGAAGARGDRGAPGLDASDGDDGWSGPPGRDGARGRDGTPGVDGADGEDAILIPGPRGPSGPPGAVLMLGDVIEDQCEPPFMPPAPGSPPDFVSFHFYLDHTTPPGGPVGQLVPSSKTPENPGVGTLGFFPSVGKMYVRGELIVNVILNNLVGGETYAAQVTVNGGATASSSTVTFTSGSAGFIYKQFLTGSGAVLDQYAILVSGNASSKAVILSAVLRLFER